MELRFYDIKYLKKEVDPHHLGNLCENLLVRCVRLKPVQSYEKVTKNDVVNEKPKVLKKWRTDFVVTIKSVAKLICFLPKKLGDVIQNIKCQNLNAEQMLKDVWPTSPI